MTDIKVKHRIIALVSYAFVALILTVRSALPFTFVFFGFMGLVVFFAEKFINSEKIKERTLFAFFVFAACYQTFYQLFNRTHDNGKQIMIAVGLAVFLISVFAATDIKKLPLSIVSAPLLCFLDARIATAYCLLLISFSVIKFRLHISGNKFAKKRNKKKQGNKNTDKAKEQKAFDPVTVILFSILISAICLIFCIVYVFINNVHTIEKTDYLVTQFKNTFGFIVFIGYLLIKLLKSKLRIKVGIIVSLILNIVATVLFTINYGWAFFSLFLITAIMLLGLICLESEDIVNDIKKDFTEHKYVFLVMLLCLLQ